MIEIEGLTIELPGFTVRDVDLKIGEGEFFSLLGPTGAGKTLILESIAGLVHASRGRIRIAGRDVTGLPPERRQIGIVYQDHALFPHLTVQENIEYGLRYRHLDPKETETRVGWLVETLDLAHLTDRRTAHLSGGEMQRVSLARALAVKPSVLLLDEPLSALDPNFREEIRKALKRLHRELKITFLMVTHDFAEALFLAERAAVIRNGSIEQVGAASEVFQRPATPFVAEFVGMKNIFPGSFSEGKAEFCGLVCPLLSASDGGCTHLALRPEDIAVRKQNTFPPDYVVYSGVIEGIVNLGFHYEVGIRCGSADFKAYLDRKTLFGSGVCEGETVLIGFDAAAVHTF